MAYDPAREWELGDPRQGPQLEAERSRADDALLKAEESLRIAQLNYGATVSRTSSSAITGAEANLLNAELALQAAREGPTDGNIAAAERSVRQAELSLQQTLLNQESHALSLTQAQLNVANAEEAVAGTSLIAPIAGTVMAINGHVGETAPNGIIVLADLEQPMLEIFVDETDLNMVGLNYEVEVAFDALPDDVFTGRIMQIDPELFTSAGVTTVRALVQLDESSFAKPQTLPVGLNATVEVIGGRVQNALLVPVEALRELSPGEYAVFVLENGEPRLRFVEVGLMDFTFAEILSGVEAGDVVTTGIVETK
jgi:multidrug efflux pump subunit AcrA (membrane-fusion protein)